MTADLLPNLLAYSGQIAIIIGIGAAGLALAKVDAAGVRSAGLRAILVLCVALPWLQSRQSIAAANGAAGVAVGSTGVSALTVRAATPLPAIDWTTLILGMLVAGIALRLAWIGLGLWRLRELRRAGEIADPCPQHEELQRLLGTRAEIRSVANLEQPVTFGTLHPVVLLPRTLHGHSADVQRAVLAHELFHVQRRDWAWLLAEEVLRAVLWFHPAMWWLVSRVQLAREEVVDELVVLLTGRRRTYAEALVAFSDDTPLAPLTAFARRRHLFRRVALISREGVMSSRQIVAAGCAIALFVAAGSWGAVRAFPLRQPVAPAASAQAGPLERRARPITPENPIPRRVAAPLPLYPADLAEIDGTVTLRLTLDDAGRVAESRVLDVAIKSKGFSLSMSGPEPTADMRAGANADLSQVRQAIEAFRRSALAAVNGWRYDTPFEAPVSFDVRVEFAPGTSAVTANAPHATVAGQPVQLVEKNRRADGRPIEVSGEVYRRADTTARPTEAQSDAFERGAMKAGGDLQPRVVKDVKAVYPPIAMEAKVQGIVIVEARIDADGTVSDARVLKSIPLLDQAALDAVRQWQFTPAVLNGVATPVVVTLTMSFSLR